MIKVENIETFNFEGAIRGMRNPLNSWDRSDSKYETFTTVDDDGNVIEKTEYIVGSNDRKLMKQLCKSGTEHRKYLRQIFVSMDIVAPLFWWKQAETFKVGTTSNSCSTMHKITSKPIELSDFSCDDFNIDAEDIYFSECMKNVIADCESLRKYYLKTKDKKYWRGLIQLLPSSYNQRRTITMNYENVLNMIRQRRHHKLKEWRDFVDILLDLPMVRELVACMSLNAEETNSSDNELERMEEMKTEYQKLKSIFAKLDNYLKEEEARRKNNKDNKNKNKESK